MSRSETPTRDALRRRFLKLSALNVASNLTVPIASLVDTAMLGHLHEIRFLAGVALAAVIFDYLFWAFGFLRMATTGLVAVATGRGNSAEASLVLSRSLVVAFALGVLSLLGAPLIREAGFALLAGTPSSEAVGRIYFDARILGAPAVFANLAFAGYFIGSGRSGAALAMAIAQNIGNALLNVWFIWGLGLQARGAGLASMASQYASLLVALALLGWLRSIRLPSLGKLLDRHALRALFALNRDLLVRTLLMLTVFAAFTNMSALGGEARLAAFAILIRLLTAAAYVIDGAAFSIEAIAGGLWQQNRLEDLRWLIWLAMRLGFATAGVLSVALLLSEGHLFSLLTEHAAVVAIAHDYQFWMLATVFVGVVAWIYDGLFIGLTWGVRLRRAAWWSAGVFLPGALAAWWSENAHLLWFAFFSFTTARAVSLTVAWYQATRSTPPGHELNTA